MLFAGSPLGAFRTNVYDDGTTAVALGPRNSNFLVLWSRRDFAEGDLVTSLGGACTTEIPDPATGAICIRWTPASLRLTTPSIYCRLCCVQPTTPHDPAAVLLQYFNFRHLQGRRWSGLLLPPWSHLRQLVGVQFNTDSRPMGRSLVRPHSRSYAPPPVSYKHCIAFSQTAAELNGLIGNSNHLKLAVLVLHHGRHQN